MACAATDLTMVQGDTTIWDVAVTDSGVAADITGATLWYTAKYSLSDTDGNAIFQKTNGDGITITNAAGGLAQIVMANADTVDVVDFLNRERVVFYDLQLKTAGGRIFTVARGKLTIAEEATEATS